MPEGTKPTRRATAATLSRRSPWSATRLRAASAICSRRIWVSSFASAMIDLYCDYTFTMGGGQAVRGEGNDRRVRETHHHEGTGDRMVRFTHPTMLTVELLAHPSPYVVNGRNILPRTMT